MPFIDSSIDPDKTTIHWRDTETLPSTEVVTQYLTPDEKSSISEVLPIYKAPITMDNFTLVPNPSFVRKQDLVPPSVSRVEVSFVSNNFVIKSNFFGLHVLFLG